MATRPDLRVVEREDVAGRVDLSSCCAVDSPLEASERVLDLASGETAWRVKVGPCAKCGRWSIRLERRFVDQWAEVAAVLRRERDFLRSQIEAVAVRLLAYADRDESVPSSEVRVYLGSLLDVLTRPEGR